MALIKCVLLMLFTCVCSEFMLSEDAVMRVLLSDYNPLIYPGSHNYSAVTVHHGLILVNIVEVDKTKLVLDVYEYLAWTDPRLVWQGKPSAMRIPASKIWTPDIVNMDRPIKRDYEPNAVVSSDGKVMYVPATRLETRYWQQSNGEIGCTLKYGSWTYSGDLIDLQLKNDFVGLSDYRENTVYEVVNTTAQRVVEIYDCCPDKYPSILYSIWLKPRF